MMEQVEYISIGVRNKGNLMHGTLLEDQNGNLYRFVIAMDDYSYWVNIRGIQGECLILPQEDNEKTKRVVKHFLSGYSTRLRVYAPE